MLNIESDSEICICIHFPLKDHLLEKLNKSIYIELSKLHKIEIDKNTLKNSILFSTHYQSDFLGVEFSINVSNREGVKQFFKIKSKEHKDQLKKSNTNQEQIKKILKGTEVMKKKLSKQFEVTHGFIRYEFSNLKAYKSDILINKIEEVREILVLKEIEKHKIVSFLFSACLKLVIDNKKHTLLPKFINRFKSKSTENVEDKLGEFSIVDFGWNVDKSPIGLNYIGIDTRRKGKTLLELRLSFNTKTISDLSKKVVTAMTVAKSIVLEGSEIE